MMTHSNNLFEQFRSAEEEVSKDFGEFKLFGLFEREDLPGKYDVIVSGSGLKGSELNGSRASLVELADRVGNAIDNDTWWTKIGKFVILPEDDPFVIAVLQRMPNDSIEHDLHPLYDFAYEGDIIRNAVIITALKSPVRRMTAHPVAA